jgi:hypothetical protein
MRPNWLVMARLAPLTANTLLLLLHSRLGANPQAAAAAAAVLMP